MASGCLGCEIGAGAGSLKIYGNRAGSTVFLRHVTSSTRLFASRMQETPGQHHRALWAFRPSGSAEVARQPYLRLVPEQIPCLTSLRISGGCSESGSCKAELLHVHDLILNLHA